MRLFEKTNLWKIPEVDDLATEALSWYSGEPLLALLETLALDNVKAATVQPEQLLFPVQFVAHQGGSSEDDFRGYQGKIERGQLSVGQRVRVLPSQQTAQVTAIYSIAGETYQANNGEVVTLCLDHDVDISRGDYLVAENSELQPSRALSASICWLDNAPLNPHRKYLLKHTTQTVTARIQSVNQVLNMHNLSSDNSEGRDNLGMNDIGQVSLKLQRPIVPQHYEDNHAAGAFILIDEATNHTMVAGMIDGFSADDAFAVSI